MTVTVCTVTVTVTGYLFSNASCVATVSFAELGRCIATVAALVKYCAKLCLEYGFGRLEKFETQRVPAVNAMLRLGPQTLSSSICLDGLDLYFPAGPFQIVVISYHSILKAVTCVNHKGSRSKRKTPLYAIRYVCTKRVYLETLSVFYHCITLLVFSCFLFLISNKAIISSLRMFLLDLIQVIIVPR